MNDQNKTHVISRAVIVHDNKILLCKTLDLNPNFYYLPGGHVANGESAAESLFRELKAETGLECKIQKFLGCLEHGFEPQHAKVCHNHEYNFVFKAESEHITSDKKITCLKKYIEFVWVPISKLSEIDLRANILKELLPKWVSENNTHELMSSMA